MEKSLRTQRDGRVCRSVGRKEQEEVPRRTQGRKSGLERQRNIQDLRERETGRNAKKFQGPGLTDLLLNSCPQGP